MIRRTERALETDDFAVLIVDDSILEKAHTDADALLCTHYDHRLGRYVKGLNFVSLLDVVGALSVPIAVELVEKTQAVTDAKTQKVSYKSPLTKNEMLRAMLRVAQPQVAYRYLLADSWYASAGNMNQVRELGFGPAHLPHRGPERGGVGQRGISGPRYAGFPRPAAPARLAAGHRRGGARGPTSFYQQGRFAGRVILGE